MSDKKWLSTRKAADELGVGYEYLLDNRLTKFKAGYHWRLVNPAAVRPTFRWHHERCAAVIDKDTKKAAKIELSQQDIPEGRGIQLPFLDNVEPYVIE